MEKPVVRFSSEPLAEDEEGDCVWYVFEEKELNEVDSFCINPWSKAEAITQKKFYFLDDCAFTIRPARMEDRIGPSRDEPPSAYFIEIANQDGSLRLCSRRSYSWDDAIKYANTFKSLSFSTASKVWKLKKP